MRLKETDEKKNLGLTQEKSSSRPSFSRLSKKEKIEKVLEKLPLVKRMEHKHILESFWSKDENFQKIFDQFSENTISNFPLPFNVLPELIINDQSYCIPMVTEESSVVAASARASKFWNKLGGVHCQVIDTQKSGQVHFYWERDPQDVRDLFEAAKSSLIEATFPFCQSMRNRGGGLSSLELKNLEEKNYYQLWANFETCDAMGANFINTVLEVLAREWEGQVFLKYPSPGEFQIIMSILSNLTPDCLVKARVECPIADLKQKDMPAEEFALKFVRALKVAEVDPFRATTHNKGIMNGIDAVVVSTGNDFRAVEACAHAYASYNRPYTSLTKARVDKRNFVFELEVPLALGTVGGLTTLHPLANLSLDLLNRPTAAQLMQIAAGVGLMQNFAAVSSLVTTGIQKGHMKMHLMNICNHLEVEEKELEKVIEFFKDKVVSFSGVKNYLRELREYQ